MFEAWPFTNFHDLNMDWLISKWKKLEENLDDIHASMDAAAASAQDSADSAAESLNYRNQAKGFSEDAEDSAQDAATEASNIEALADQITVNTSRIDNLVANAGDTDNNAELLDIRVGGDGVIYPTAGDAVRATSYPGFMDSVQGYFEENIYNSSAGTQRRYLTYDFKPGVWYWLYVRINTLTADGIGFAFKTVNNDYNSVVDTIWQEPSNTGYNYAGEAYTYSFVATAAANKLYIYTKTPNDNPVADLDVILFAMRDSVTDMIGDIQFRDLSITTSGNTSIVRTFWPFNAIAGETYELYFEIENWNFDNHDRVTQCGFNLRTTIDDTTNTITDNIVSSLISATSSDRIITNTTYKATWTASTNTNYLYIYTTNKPGENNNAHVMLRRPEHLILTTYDLNDDLGQYQYDGQKVKLSKNMYDEAVYKTLSKGTVTTQWQGMSIYSDKLYTCFHGGYINVYDLTSNNSTLSPIDEFQLGSFDASDNHANCMNFSNTFYSGNTIPLAYVTIGNSGPVMKCSVENIVESGGSYTATALQTITLDQSGFTDADLMEYWGWPSWIPDPDGEYLYVFGARYRTNGSMNAYYDQNKYIVTKFRLPDLSDATVTLGAADVLEQFTTLYNVNYMQGGSMFNGNIFYSFGNGTNTFPSAVRVYSTEEKALVSSIDMPQIAEEFEDCVVYDNALYINTQSGHLYKVTF